MKIELLLQFAAVAQLGIALLNLLLTRLLGWRDDIARMPLLLHQVFHVHAWFISITLSIFALMTWQFAGDLARGANDMSRWLAASIGVFWAVRTVLQFTYYSSSHWRGRMDRTVIHVVLLLLYGGFAAVYFWAAGAQSSDSARTEISNRTECLVGSVCDSGMGVPFVCCFVSSRRRDARATTGWPHPFNLRVAATPDAGSGFAQSRNSAPHFVRIAHFVEDFSSSPREELAPCDGRYESRDLLARDYHTGRVGRGPRRGAVSKTILLSPALSSIRWRRGSSVATAPRCVPMRL
jgi:hypothetical protein